MTHAALQGTGLSIHAALGVQAGGGVLFPGASGRGKSTLAKDFVEIFGQADDVAILRKKNAVTGFFVGPCMTRKKTWANVGTGEPARLKALAFLEQSSEATQVEPIALKKRLIEYDRGCRVQQTSG